MYFSSGFSVEELLQVFSIYSFVCELFLMCMEIINYTQIYFKILQWIFLHAKQFAWLGHLVTLKICLQNAGGFCKTVFAKAHRIKHRKQVIFFSVFVYFKVKSRTLLPGMSMTSSLLKMVISRQCSPRNFEGVSLCCSFLISSAGIKTGQWYNPSKVYLLIFQ